MSQQRLFGNKKTRTQNKGRIISAITGIPEISFRLNLSCMDQKGVDLNIRRSHTRTTNEAGRKRRQRPDSIRICQFSAPTQEGDRDPLYKTLPFPLPDLDLFLSSPLPLPLPLRPLPLRPLPLRPLSSPSICWSPKACLRCYFQLNLTLPRCLLFSVRARSKNLASVWKPTPSFPITVWLHHVL